MKKNKEPGSGHILQVTARQAPKNKAKNRRRKNGREGGGRKMKTAAPLRVQMFFSKREPKPATL